MRDRCFCLLGWLIGFATFAFCVPFAIAADDDASAVIMKAGAATGTDLGRFTLRLCGCKLASFPTFLELAAKPSDDLDALSLITASLPLS